MNKDEQKPIWILFTTSEASYFAKRFSQPEREFYQILAFDGLVSEHLSRLGIEHNSADDIINISDRNVLLTSSTTRLIENINHIENDDFFDCVKYQKFLEFLSIVYHHAYLSRLVLQSNIHSISSFDSEPLVNILLQDICSAQSISYTKVNLPLYVKWNLTLKNKIPLITKKKDVLYRFFIERIKRPRTVLDVIATIKNQKEKKIALCTPFDIIRTLNNALTGMHTLVDEDVLVIVPLKKGLTKSDRRAAEHNPQILTCDTWSISYPAKNHQRDLQRLPLIQGYIRNTLKGVLHTTFAMEQIEHQTHFFGLEAWYNNFLATQNFFEYLYSKLHPSIFLGDNFYDCTTRVGVMIAQKYTIPSFAVTKIHEELFSPPLVPTSATPYVIDRYLPSAIAVHLMRTKQKLAIHRTTSAISSPIITQMATKERARQPTPSVPRKDFVIIFTTQQHPYSFDYTQIVVDILASLSNKVAAREIRLIIKPHPVEYAFFYRRALKRQSPQVTIDTSITMDEVFAQCDVLITSHSFTAYEALQRGKRVILLTLSRRAVDPDILLYRPEEFNNPLLTEVFSSDNLLAVLLEMVG